VTAYRRPKPEDFNNCIELLICVFCKRYIGQNAAYYTINYDDDPTEWSVGHVECIEGNYVDDDDDAEGEDGNGYDPLYS
jgi:hypothetical protein